MAFKGFLVFVERMFAYMFSEQWGNPEQGLVKMHHGEIEDKGRNHLPDFEFGDYQCIPGFLYGLEG